MHHLFLCRRAPAALVCSLAGWLTACTTPPSADAALARAAFAIDQARAAGAVMSAPQPLNSARFKLERARVLAERDDDPVAAERLADEARADALAACRQAGALRAAKG